MLKCYAPVVLALFAAIAQGQQNTSPSKPQPPETTEITKHDFTKLDELRSSKVTVFGVQLGQTQEQAQAAIGSAPIMWRMVPMAIGEPMPFLYDADGHELAQLDIVDGHVSKIRLKPDISRYLAGESRKLFDATTLEPTSSTRLELLGHEDEYTHEWSNVLDGDERHFRYFKEGIEVSGVAPNSKILPIEVQFFVPAKQRQ